VGAELIIKYIVANPWRAVCFILAAACAALYIAMRFQSLAIGRADLAREKAEAQVAKLVVDGIVQDRAFAVASIEMTRLKKQQRASAQRVKDLLANWPKTCEAATAQALAVLREHRK
jgi:hypothetical protein